jgi:hypothetical protein
VRLRDYELLEVETFERVIQVLDHAIGDKFGHRRPTLLFNCQIRLVEFARSLTYVIAKQNFVRENSVIVL